MDSNFFLLVLPSSFSSYSPYSTHSIMSAPGTTNKLIRNLAHMLPPPKGSKFANVKYPTQHRHRGKWVPTKDRFPFWNITVGDTVVLRRGKQITTTNQDGEEDKIMPKGIVVSLDREKNWLWLRDVDVSRRIEGTTFEDWNQNPKLDRIEVIAS